MSAAFEIAGLAVLVSASIACFWRKRSAFAFIGGFLLVVFANPDRVQSLTASVSSARVEAKLRDLGSTINSAKAVLDQLKALAVNTAKSLIQLREGQNAILASSQTDEYKAQDAYKASLLQNLRNMGVSPADIKEVAQSDSNIVLAFYANAAYRWARDSLPQSQWRAFDSAYSRIEEPASPDEINKLLNDFRVGTPGFSSYMDDYRYYAKTLEQRRPLVWASRSAWGFGQRH